MFPDVTASAVPFTPDNTINQDRQAHWEAELSKEAQQRKATAAATKTLNPTEIEELARLYTNQVLSLEFQLSTPNNTFAKNK